MSLFPLIALLLTSSLAFGHGGDDGPAERIDFDALSKLWQSMRMHV